MANNSNAILLVQDLSLDGVAVDGFVTSLSVEITRDMVEVPATAGNRNKGHKAGAADSTITITYLQAENSANLNITEILYDAILSASGELVFSGKISESSPWRYSGTCVVNSFVAGGDTYTIGTHSVTFPVNGPITRASVAS